MRAVLSFARTKLGTTAREEDPTGRGGLGTEKGRKVECVCVGVGVRGRQSSVGAGRTPIVVHRRRQDCKRGGDTPLSHHWLCLIIGGQVESVCCTKSCNVPASVLPASPAMTSHETSSQPSSTTAASRVPLLCKFQTLSQEALHLRARCRLHRKGWMSRTPYPIPFSPGRQRHLIDFSYPNSDFELVDRPKVDCFTRQVFDLVQPFNGVTISKLVDLSSGQLKPQLASL